MCKYIESRTELRIFDTDSSRCSKYWQKRPTQLPLPSSVIMRAGQGLVGLLWLYSLPIEPHTHNTHVRCTSLDMWFAIKSQCHSRSVVVVVVIVGPSFYPPERSTAVCTRTWGHDWITESTYGRKMEAKADPTVGDCWRVGCGFNGVSDLMTWIRFGLDDTYKIPYTQQTHRRFRTNERMLAPFGLGNWSG